VNEFLDYQKSRSLLDRLATARVARLATHNPRGGIDLVPCTFALVNDDTIVTAIDHKPKRTARLQRLENIRTNPSVTVLVDHYDDDWSTLWWVRARGDARVVDHLEPALVEALVVKYGQYADHRPDGAAIVIHVTELSGWSAGDY
jgi:PPOX class probable F420-dependent enzyme